MNHSYRFSNLLGATYKGGAVCFTPDGNVLLSPVGNRVSAVDLVQGRAITLAPENREDVAVLALTRDNRLLLSVDGKGHALLINFVRCAVLTRINFKAPVQSAKWSPDSQWLLVTHGRKVELWRTPTLELGWQFVRHHTFSGHHDDVVDVSWAPNSLFFTSCSKDGAVRLWAVNPMDGFSQMALLEHLSPVRAAFFSSDMRYIYSMSRDGVLVSVKYTLTDEKAEASRETPLYCQPGKWAVESKASCQQPALNKVTRCDFDAGSGLLAVGFSRGVFMLFEMPGLQALQTLSLGIDPLDSVALGAKGDWLAVGSSAVGQLLVWEWRSETYVLKQQGHHWGVRCVAFSPSGVSSMRRTKTLSTAEAAPGDKSSALGGRLMATGGYDGKVKLFNAQSGLCFVTFAEHTAPVSAVVFTPQGNAVISASRDGSVRAYDLLRYRNFRTFASPDGLCQFSSVAVDSGGEIVAASATGGKYAVYVWSIQTGNILEVLTGHTSHVQSLYFSPSATHPGQMVSGGWDSTLCVWDLYAGKGGGKETLQCPSSVLSVAFDPRGNDVCAAACLSGQVLFWNVANAQNIGSIDGLRDIQSGRQWGDMFSATHMKGIKAGVGLKRKNASEGVNLNQHFNAIAYARSGELLLCSSQNSPFVSLYDTSSFSLAARVTLTTNRSMSGVQVLLNSSKMTEAGVSWQQHDLSDDEADDQEAARRKQQIRQTEALPGVSVGEGKDAYTEKELRVWDVAFSADSQQFAVATTHGVFVYAAETGMGTPGASGGMYGGEVSRFVPQMLTKAVSAPAVLRALEAGELSKAMILALALNDYGLLRKVYERIPVKAIPVVIASVGSPLLPALLWFLSLELRPTAGTPHFQFHVQWVSALIDLHFQTLMELTTGRSTARTGSTIEAASTSKADVSALCLQLLVELSQRHAMVSKTFDNNTYLLRYLGSAPAEDKVPEAEAEEPVAKAQKKSRPAVQAAEEIQGGDDELDEIEQEDPPAAVGRTVKRKKKKQAAVA